MKKLFFGLALLSSIALEAKVCTRACLGGSTSSTIWGYGYAWVQSSGTCGTRPPQGTKVYYAVAAHNTDNGVTIIVEQGTTSATSINC